MYIAAEERRLDLDYYEIHWCVGFSTPRTSHQVAHLLWGDLAENTSVEPVSSPMAAWRETHLETPLSREALGLNCKYFGRAPLVGAAPSVSVCLGGPGTGKSRCMDHHSISYPYGLKYDNFANTEPFNYHAFMGVIIQTTQPKQYHAVHVASRRDPREWFDMTETQWQLFQRAVDRVHYHYVDNTGYRTVNFDRGTHSKLTPIMQYLSAFPTDGPRDHRYGEDNRPWLVSMDSDEDTDLLEIDNE